MIEVTDSRLFINTPGFGFNTLHRVAMPELWQWHEAVANAIANHHAGVMGWFLPCPAPDVLACEDCGDTNLADDTGNGNPGWFRCACGGLHQPDRDEPEPVVSTTLVFGLAYISECDGVLCQHCWDETQEDNITDQDPNYWLVGKRDWHIGERCDHCGCVEGDPDTLTVHGQTDMMQVDPYSPRVPLKPEPDCLCVGCGAIHPTLRTYSSTVPSCPSCQPEWYDKNESKPEPRTTHGLAQWLKDNVTFPDSDEAED